MKEPFPAAKVLKPDSIPTYRAEIDLLWSQAVGLNANLYLLDKLARFPFDLFLPNADLCWLLFQDAIYESCVMAIWRIVVDKKGIFLTLGGLKGYVFANALDTPEAESVKEEVAKLRFEKSVSTTAEVVRRIRHEWLAHLKRDAAVIGTSAIPSVPIITVEEMQRVAETVNELIRVLSFDAGRAFVYLEYDPSYTPPRGIDPRKDIEKLLDEIADQSELLHVPEERPDDWPHQRSLLSDDELKLYNDYRRRLDLPDA